MKMGLSSYGISDYGTPTDNPAEIIFNGKIMQLGRWPNSSFETDTTPVDNNQKYFTYTGSRPSGWTSGSVPYSDAYVAGHFYSGYFQSITAISSIDTGNARITLAELPYGGLSSYNGIWSNRAWYALNLLEEIDMPGEYYIDKTNEILYFWPPDSLTGSELLISAYPNLMEIRAGYLEFKDLFFEGTTGQLASLMYTDHVTFDGCTFRNCGERALGLLTVEDCSITNCDFYDTASLGMTVNACGDRVSLTDANIVIANNYFARSGRYKTGVGFTPLIWVFQNNCGVTIRNNHFEDSPDSGLMLNGNNHLVEYNRFWRCPSIDEDQAAIYCPGDWTSLQGCIFRYNEIYDSHSSLPDSYYNITMGIYFDFNGSGGYCYGNIIHTLDHVAFYSNGGRDNTYSNNIIVDAPAAFYSDDDFDHPSCEDLLAPLLAVNYKASPWSVTFPQLTDIPDDCDDPDFDDYRHPLNCSVDKTITDGCPTFSYGDGIGYYDFLDIPLEDTDPCFIDEDNLVFALRDDSPAYNISGFTRIPWERIGLLDTQKATRPIPLDSSEQQRALLNFYWAPAFSATTHKVYLGTNPDAVMNRTDGTFLSHTVEPGIMNVLLIQGTTYYWLVDEYDTYGQLVGSGDCWSFTTAGIVMLACDLDHDSDVDFEDMAFVFTKWLEDGCNSPAFCDGADVDNSGAVNLYDFSICAAMYPHSIFICNFEAPTFMLGDLHNQNIWCTDGAGIPGAANVSVISTVNSGSYVGGQAVSPDTDAETYAYPNYPPGRDFGLGCGDVKRMTADVYMGLTNPEVQIWARNINYESWVYGPQFGFSGGTFYVRNTAHAEVHHYGEMVPTGLVGHWIHLTFDFDIVQGVARLTAYDLTANASIDTGLDYISVGAWNIYPTEQTMYIRTVMGDELSFDNLTFSDAPVKGKCSRPVL